MQASFPLIFIAFALFALSSCSSFDLDKIQLRNLRRSLLGILEKGNISTLLGNESFEAKEDASVSVDFSSSSRDESNNPNRLKLSTIIPNIPDDSNLTGSLISFFRKFRIENEFTRDTFEMVLYNYLDEGYMLLSPLTVDRYIINFFHEYFYGPEMILPEDTNDWRKSFILKLIKGYKLDKTVEFFKNNMISPPELIDSAKLIIDCFHNNLENISESNMQETISTFLQISMNTGYMKEIYYGLCFLEISNLPDPNMDAIHFAFDQPIFTRSVWKFISSADDLLRPYFETRNGSSNFGFNKELVKKFLGPSVNGFEYLLTRDSSNPFKMQELYSKDFYLPNLMSEFLNCATPTLTEIEIFSQIFQAGLFPAGLYHQAKSHPSSAFCQILESHNL